MKLYEKIFESNINLLKEEAGLNKEEILKSRTDEACDCRFILIYVARHYKLTDTEIVKFSNFTRQQLQRATEQEAYRLKKLFVSLLVEKCIRHADKIIEDFRNL